jgi:hypothetical protein
MFLLLLLCLLLNLIRVLAGAGNSRVVTFFNFFFIMIILHSLSHANNKLVCKLLFFDKLFAEQNVETT